MRPRPERAQPGALDAALLPRRVPGAHPRPQVSGEGVQGADHLHDRPGDLQRLRRLHHASAPARRSWARRTSCTRSSSRCAPSAAPASSPASSTRCWSTRSRHGPTHDQRLAGGGGGRLHPPGGGAALRHPHPDAVPRRRPDALRCLPPVRGGGGRRASWWPRAAPAPSRGWWCAPTRSGWSGRAGCCSSCTSRPARSPSASRTSPPRMGVRECRYAAQHEDCIQCGLCVRICNEQMMAGAIGFAGRGKTRHVSRPFEQTSELCRQCGACLYVCPVCELRCQAPHRRDRAVQRVPEHSRRRASRPTTTPCASSSRATPASWPDRSVPTRAPAPARHPPRASRRPS